MPVDGGVLVTCAPAADVRLFADGATEPAWTLTARCTSDVDVITHAVPVAIE